MASVRLTKELQKRINAAVRESFDEVLDGYEIDNDTAEAVKKYALAQLHSENSKYRQARIEFNRIFKSIKDRYGAEEVTNEEYHVNALLRNTVDTYGRYSVYAVDPESEEQEEVEIYSDNRVYYELDASDRRVLAGSTLCYGQGRVCRDKDIVDMVLPTFLKRRSILHAREVALEYSRNMMSKCNTLGQLLRKWPDAVNYVPESYLAELNETTKAKARPQPVAPDSIMNIDEAMKSIRLQAEAVKALRG